MTERHIVLVGLMSSGKSTVGALLADRLGRRRRDSDDDIELGHGRKASYIAETDGVDALHEIEHRHLLDALAEDEPVVVGAAASVADSEECVRAMEEAFVVWLQLDVSEIAEGYGTKDHRRDLGDDPEQALREQLERRGPVWAKVADLELPDAKHRPATAVDAIVSAARAAGAVS
jgi:shikimate kinase